MWLSIIIPTFKDDDSLKRLLYEFDAWDLNGVEVLIIDGQKRSRPSWINKKYFYFHTGRPGRGFQLHLGGAIAHGDKLLFVHADSRFPKGSPLEILKKSDADVGFFKIEFDDPDRFFKILASGSNLRAKKAKLIFGDQGLFLKKSVYLKSGGYPEQKLMEDYEFSRILNKLGYRFTEFDFPIMTSARKYKEEGRYKLFLKMQLFKIAYILGVSPDELSQKYYRGDKNDRTDLKQN
jgi:Glycosyltransferases involved in cell wall biogenesis